MKKALMILLVVCIIGAVLTGCGEQPPTQQSATQQSEAASGGAAAESAAAGEDLSETGTLKMLWFQGFGVDTIFESPIADIQSLYPMMVFSTLVKAVPEDGSYKGSLAEYDISDDGLVYTFKIDPNANFTDGTPVTAEDVIFTLTASLAWEKSLFSNFLIGIVGADKVKDGSAAEVEGLKALDEKTVEITLAQPDSTLMVGLALAGIIPKHGFEGVEMKDVALYEEFWKKPIGSGQYKIDQVSFPDYFTLVRNDDYFGPKAGIKNVLFTSYDVGGAEAGAAAAVAGDLDYVYGNMFNDIALMDNVIAQNPDMTKALVPSSYTRSIYFNLTESADGKFNDAVKDIRVREAISLLVDKETIAGFYGEQGVVANSLINPNDVYYDTTLTPFKRDVEKAKQLLDEAGFDYNSTIRLTTHYTDQTTQDVMEVIKQNLADGGIKVESSVLNGDINSLKYEQKNYELCYGGLMPAGDAVSNYALLYSTGRAMDKTFGDVDVRKTTYDEFYRQYVSTNDPAEKKQWADKLQEQEAADIYAIDLYQLNQVVGYNKGHVQLDESIFAGDYTQSKDYMFENWKLIG